MKVKTVVMKKKQLIAEPTTGKYINPFTDFGFKKIFGEEPNKDLLIDFLNELLREQNQHIQNLTYKKTENLGASDIDRKVVFDLYCENERGEKFIVEMQKAKQTHFKERTLFYSTFPIQEQALKGEWDYSLKAVFAIAILDFTFDDPDKTKTITTYVKLTDIDRNEVFYNKLTYVFIQMPNFEKTEAQLETHFDKWLYLLKNLHKFEEIPVKLREKIFQKVFKIAEIAKLKPEERQKYEDSLKYYRDLKNSLDNALSEGYNLARNEFEPMIEQERLQKEEAQRQIEEERRLKDEALRKQEEMIRVLYQQKISIEQIASISGKDINEINRIIGL